MVSASRIMIIAWDPRELAKLHKERGLQVYGGIELMAEAVRRK
ncbi:hypothetical protein [Desulfosporosinus shakirovi]|nr:hypothetical protein [Desulfosporosinus sp. SRJS8]